MTPQANLLLSGLVTALWLGGCTGPGAPVATPTTTSRVTTTTVASSPTPPVTEKEAAAIGANELGSVPVLMYHRVLRHPTSDYDIAPGAFLKELRRLFEEGYRPIRAIDLARGDIDVPAGKSPVVLTFDDSSREQFGYRPDGSVDPRTALGILIRFSETHPAFHAVATMYVNALPFGSAEGPAMLRDLAARGFELGNHTASHADLSSLSSRGVKRELVLGKRVITGAVPKAEVRTMALPLGQKPDDPHLASNGSWGGTSYRHLAVMLVGAEPAPSPFSSLWKPRAVPRIRTSSWNGKAPNYGSEFWLDQLRAHPEDRYVSDGDPGVVSFPKALRRQLAARFQGSAVGY